MTPESAAPPAESGVPLVEPSARPYGRRADAARNRESILDHAVGLLADDPAIGMAEIAHAAGIGRATLYRHFATREDLIAAIDARACAEAERTIAASRLEQGSAAEALARLISGLLAIGDRYCFLFGEDAVPSCDEQRRREHEQRVAAPLYALVARGQASGELSTTLSATWMLTVLGAVIVTAVREIAAGRLDRRTAPEIVTATLLHGYRPLADGR